MRVLILGGHGMLGHKMYQVFRENFDVYTTVRGASDSHTWPNLLEQDRVINGIDVLDLESLRSVLDTVRPDTVVNCVGIIKQLQQSRDAVASIATNSLFPHQLSALCGEVGARLIHVSTDCVFSGNRGGYLESDTPDPIDLYGRSKWIGEVSDDPHALTVRTSIIGRELSGASALVEWFLAQEGPSVTGFTNAIFSGLPTISLARIIVLILQNYPDLHGLYHVSAEPISKYDLLGLVRDAYGLSMDIYPSPEPRIDRSLNSDRFRKAIGYTPPDWRELISEMATDPTPYSDLRI